MTVILDKELESLVILTSLPHLGSIKIRLMIQHYGSAEAALHADPAEIAYWPGFGEKVSASLKSWENSDLWKKNLESVANNGVSLISYTHPQYPKRLLEIHDFPVLLYVKGSFKTADQQSIAVIGTRSASVYGHEMANSISQDLASMGFSVVSGLARGIDTAAHSGALKTGRTLAVIGSGLADIYPRENFKLSQAIAENGALISEFPMDTPPDRLNFPQRNRIVSGMSMGIFLVEAPEKSGAMITMDFGRRHKRKLFALPGRVDAENFKGNHLLIKQGEAKLVENARDIAGSFEDLFGFAGAETKTSVRDIKLEPQEANLLLQLPKQELSIDDIVQLTNLPMMTLNVLLMSLVLKRVIKEFPGKRYKKCV